jgi:hypothetical protein
MFTLFDFVDKYLDGYDYEEGDIPLRKLWQYWRTRQECDKSVTYMRFQYFFFHTFTNKITIGEGGRLHIYGITYDGAKHYNREYESDEENKDIDDEKSKTKDTDDDDDDDDDDEKSKTKDTDDDDDLKCLNYAICGVRLPNWWIDCKGHLICSNCDIMWGKWVGGQGALEFVQAKACEICKEVRDHVIYPVCKHSSCIRCFARIYKYGLDCHKCSKDIAMHKVSKNDNE